MVNAETRTLQEVSVELAPQLTLLLDPAGTMLPKGASAIVQKSAKSIEFSKEQGSTRVAEALMILAVYRETERAAAVARLVAKVPNTGNLTLLDPLRSAIVMAASFQDSESVKEELEALASSAWAPLATRSKGVLLRQPLRRSAGERAKFSGFPPAYHASEYLYDIKELTVMSYLGGSFSWSRKKIAAEIAALREALFTVPGFEPIPS